MTEYIIYEIMYSVHSNQSQRRHTMFKTGQKVIVKDPVFFDEEIKGFIAKQLSDSYFLVRLEASFRRTNRGKRWAKGCRDHAEQVVREI